MNPQLVFLMAAGLMAAQALDYKALHQFRDMILCVMPDSWPIFDYTDYGCFCGRGGSGSPVDQLDRCCQVHDQCYVDAMQHPDCFPVFDNPYTELYDYSCNNRQITCSSNNDRCEMFICECDKVASECFSRSHWNPDHEHLPSEFCQNKSQV